MGQPKPGDNQWKPGPKRKKQHHIQAWLNPADGHQKHAIKTFQAYRKKGHSPAEVITMALDALSHNDVAARVVPKYQSDGERIDALEKRLAELTQMIKSGHFASDEEYNATAQEYEITHGELSSIQESIASRYEAINTDAVEYEDDEWTDE